MNNLFGNDKLETVYLNTPNIVQQIESQTLIVIKKNKTFK